jgi:hypothetical protein
LQAISAALWSPLTTWKNLGLNRCSFNEESAFVLAACLEYYNFEHLTLLDDAGITTRGWLVIITSLQHPDLPIKSIGIFGDFSIDDQVASASSRFLAAKSDVVI